MMIICLRQNSIINGYLIIFRLANLHWPGLFPTLAKRQMTQVLKISKDVLLPPRMLSQPWPTFLTIKCHSVMPKMGNLLVKPFLSLHLNQQEKPCFHTYLVAMSKLRLILAKTKMKRPKKISSHLPKVTPWLVTVWKVHKEVYQGKFKFQKYSVSISRSAHRTPPNFTNHEFFVYLHFKYFFLIKVLD